MASLRQRVPPGIAVLPRPRVTIVLGGGNGVFTYDGDCLRRLGAALRSLAASGCSFLITPSRRTPPGLAQAVEAATRDAKYVALLQNKQTNPNDSALRYQNRPQFASI